MRDPKRLRSRIPYAMQGNAKGHRYAHRYRHFQTTDYPAHGTCLDLRIGPGTKIDFMKNSAGETVIKPKLGDIRDLRGIVNYKGPPVSIEDIKKSIGDAIIEDYVGRSVIAVDSGILVHYLVQDDDAQTALATRLFEHGLTWADPGLITVTALLDESAEFAAASQPDIYFHGGFADPSGLA